MRQEMLKAIQKGLIYAIIPARSGSKGIPDKNIRDFAGHPLMAHAIMIAKAAPSIDRVIVSTDSLKYAEIAKRYGAEVPFHRPKEISGDIARDADYMIHALNWLYDNERLLPEYWVHLRPTSPVRTVKAIEDAIVLLVGNPSADCLRSAGRTTYNPHKWFVLDNDSTFFKPLMEGISMADTNNPRQGFPTTYVPDGNIDVLKTEFVVLNEEIHGERMLALITDEPLDIDTEVQWREIEQRASSSETSDLFPKMGEL